MFEKFTDAARRTVVLAQDEARLFHHTYIGSEHLLLALVREPNTVAAELLASVGISLDAARQRVEELVGSTGAATSSAHIPFTPNAKRTLEGALRDSMRLGDDYIGTAHMLLSLIHLPDSVAGRIFSDMGTNLPDLEQRIVAARADHGERLHMGAATSDLGRPPASPAAVAVQRSVRSRAAARPVRSSHYLLALFDDPSSVAAKVLASLGVTREIVEQRIAEIGTSGTTDELPTESGESSTQS